MVSTVQHVVSTVQHVVSTVQHVVSTVQHVVSTVQHVVRNGQHLAPLDKRKLCDIIQMFEGKRKLSAARPLGLRGVL